MIQNFVFILTDLCGIHYPDDVEDQFAVVYHLHNWYENKESKLAFFNGEKPEIKRYQIFS
jgi:NADH-quinone oxidoreductase subunit C